MSKIGKGLENIAAFNKIATEALQEINRRDAEIARLREALEKVVSINESFRPDSQSTAMRNMADIARAALTSAEETSGE